MPALDIIQARQEAELGLTTRQLRILADAKRYSLVYVFHYVTKKRSPTAIQADFDALVERGLLEKFTSRWSKPDNQPYHFVRVYDENGMRADY